MSDDLPAVDVAVIGAAGSTGRSLVPALARRGASIRALIRRAEQAELLPDAGQHLAADLYDVEGLTKALRGAAVAHYIPPVFNDDEPLFVANIIAAAGAAGVGRLVYHSVLHAPTPAMPHHIRKSKVELAIRESDLVWTIVQPAMYVQTQLAYFDGEKGELRPAFDVSRRFTPIDIEDLSEAVAAVLTQDGHDYATYELAGPEALTVHQMAQAVSEALGRPITARKSNAEDLLLVRAAVRRFTPAQMEELRAMYAHYDAHGLPGNGKVLAMILGRPPISFAQAARRDLLERKALDETPVHGKN